MAELLTFQYNNAIENFRRTGPELLARSADLLKARFKSSQDWVEAARFNQADGRLVRQIVGWSGNKIQHLEVMKGQIGRGAMALASKPDEHWGQTLAPVPGESSEITPVSFSGLRQHKSGVWELYYGYTPTPWNVDWDSGQVIADATTHQQSIGTLASSLDPIQSGALRLFFAPSRPQRGWDLDAVSGDVRVRRHLQRGGAFSIGLFQGQSYTLNTAGLLEEIRHTPGPQGEQESELVERYTPPGVLLMQLARTKLGGRPYTVHAVAPLLWAEDSVRVPAARTLEHATLVPTAAATFTR